ncbi:MAG: fused MFS/spermidine synthase [Candidatus Rokubacteria bacterium]|nr:fused MFS/spermidine synthase [Candidatus Rokubacteria bacterium]
MPAFAATQEEPESMGWAGLGIVAVCFFLSGATGLVYQVVWLRLLSLVFGHTVYAITTVLAAFMAGLGLGSFLLGRRAHRIDNLIGAYGWLEVGIGLYCALLPGLLWAASAAYLGLQREWGTSHATFSLIQFLLVFALLLVPTTLMGGTLPVLSQALARDAGGLGRTIGALYALNTFGALAGVALAGYVLIPMAGNRLSVWVAAAANLAVGALAIAYSRAVRVKVEAPGGALEAAGPPDPGAELDWPTDPPSPAWLALAALGVSGAVSMVYEVAWTRALSLVTGSSTYAFTAMLIAFLLGIAGGSALYSLLWGRRPASAASFGVLQAGTGLATALTVLLFEQMPALFLAGLAWSDSPAFVQLLQVVVSVAALLPSTLFIGATFPCAVAMAAREVSRAGHAVGRVYAANTAGAIAGAMLGGFALVPLLGVHGSLKAGVAVNLLLAAVLLAYPPYPLRAWRWAALATALPVALAMSVLPPWDQGVMASGPAIYGKSYLREGGVPALRRAMRSKEMLYYRDGPSATVAVHRMGERIVLRVNGKTDASTGGDMPTQIMSGHLPLLVHPDPRQVLIIGLGSGITAGAVARHPVERVDVVEIEPGVVEASRFFAHLHGDVLKDPRLRTAVADGRNFLLTTRERYDVIISEPSNPWISGLASLFSVEFFRLAREHLRAGGLMLQWVQGYNLEPDDLKMVVRTFRTAFPATSIWQTSGGDFLLLGAAEPVRIDLARVKARHEASAGLRRDFERLGLPVWSGILGYFALGETDAEKLPGHGPLNTDDRLPLEFAAPRALYVDTTQRNFRLVRGFSTAEFPPVTAERELATADAWYGLGLGLLRRGSSGEALARFGRALELSPDHALALLQASATSLSVGRPADALSLARRAIQREPRSAQALLLAGLAAERLHSRAEALAFLERAATLAPEDPRIRRAVARLQLAELRGDAPSGPEEDYLADLLGR